MHSTGLTIAWVRDLPRLAAAAQSTLARDHGVDARDVIVDGAKLPSGRVVDWSWLMRKLRPGDTLAVAQLRAIYAPDGKLTVRRALYQRLHQVEDAGIVIVELSTGRRSDRARERDMMIADCLDELARAAQGRDGGRPRLELSADEVALVEQHWPLGSKGRPSWQHATNQAAVTAIRTEAKARKYVTLLRLRSVQAYINRFGASGRGGRLKRQPK